MFCPKCGGILMPKKDGKKTSMTCMKCGYKDIKDGPAVLSEKVEHQKEVAVIEKDVEVLPVVETECPKCGHRKAKFWTQQTRAGDEGDTKFFKCEKCKHTWREYD